MSSDTAKEYASVVDSSVSECKYVMKNWDDPENSSLKENNGSSPLKAKERRHSHDRVEIVNSSKEYGTRYFIIKSLNHQNLQLSIDRGIWATQVMNEPVLEEAFHRSDKIILIFSVNMSGFFQGYAQMMSSFGWRRDNVWSQGNGGNNPWGRSFKVKWLRLCDLPFQKTLHLKNPLNEYKPVKISRDCQELPKEIGEALCQLLDGNDIMQHSLDRDEFFGDGLPSKKPCIEPQCSLQDDGYNVPSVHMSWSRTPVFPSLLHQNPAETSKFHYSQSRSLHPENSSVTSSAPELDSYSKGNRTNIHVDLSRCSQFDVWGFSADRSPLSTLTEDDFLEMSYEEYLEAHSRSSRDFRLPASETLQAKQESSTSKKRNDNSCSRSCMDQSRSHKRTHASSYK